MSISTDPTTDLVAFWQEELDIPHAAEIFDAIAHISWYNGDALASPLSDLEQIVIETAHVFDIPCVGVQTLNIHQLYADAEVAAAALKKVAQVEAQRLGARYRLESESLGLSLDSRAIFEQAYRRIIHPDQCASLWQFGSRMLEIPTPSHIHDSPPPINTMDYYWSYIEYALHLCGRYYTPLPPGKVVRLATRKDFRGEEDVQELTRTLVYYYILLLIIRDQERAKVVRQFLSLIERGNFPVGMLEGSQKMLVLVGDSSV